MPLHLNDEEMSLLLSLAQPIDQRQRTHCTKQRASSAALRKRDKRLNQSRVGVRRQTLKHRPRSLRLIEQSAIDADVHPATALQPLP
jgi:hypothetical protein